MVCSGIYDGCNFDLAPINPNFPTDFIHEKNWSFTTYKHKLHVIYKWNPLQICEINYQTKELNLVTTLETPPIFEDFSGSSCAAVYNNEKWFIVHNQVNRYYKHAFVVLDEDLNPVKYSEWFYFEANREFCYGLHIENDTFIIGFSTNNSTTKINKYSVNYIESTLKMYTIDR